MARILIVDDETAILTVLSVLVKSLGHEPVTCPNGQEALKIIQSDQPLDVVITDLRMDEVNGMDVIASAKQHRPRIPVIVISAYLTEERLEAVKSVGAFGQIVKPFRMEAVRESIDAALSRPEG